MRSFDVVPPIYIDNTAKSKDKSIDINNSIVLSVNIFLSIYIQGVVIAMTGKTLKYMAE